MSFEVGAGSKDCEAMKVVTCEIAWHNKEPVYSLDFQHSSDGRTHRLATAGVDTTVRVSAERGLSRVCYCILFIDHVMLISAHAFDWKSSLLTYTRQVGKICIYGP